VDKLVEKTSFHPSMFVSLAESTMAKNNSLNFSRLSKYNYEYLSLEEVIYLEYLIFHVLRKIDIPVQWSRVKQETGLLKYRQQNAIKLLSEKGFVKIEPQQYRKKIILQTEFVAKSAQRLFLKTNKSIQRYLDQLVASPPAPKEKGKTKSQPIPKPKKAIKSALGKTALPANQIGLFD